MAIQIPAAVAAKLAEVDSTSGPLDEMGIASALRTVLPDQQTLSVDERRGAWAAIEGFRFQRPNGSDEGPWGIYWHELASGELSDGTAFYSPDITDADEEIVGFWIERSTTAKHPTVRSRFADLAWEIGRALKKPRPNATKPPIQLEIPVTLAHRAIDSYLDIVTSGLARDEYYAWQILDRAIGLSISIRDDGRIAKARDALFAYYRQISGQGKRFMWWRLDDLTKGRWKQMDLSPQDRDLVIDSLESALARHSDFTQKESFDPHAAMSAADHRAAHAGSDLKQVRRVIRTAGEAFEQAAKIASGLVAISWLQGVLTRYRMIGLIADAARVEREILRRAGDARAEMKRIEAPVNVPRAELEKWVDAVLGKTLEDSLARLGMHFIVRKESTEKTVQDLAKVAPLISNLSQDIMGNDGFSTAKIGSVTDDLDGRTVNHAATLFGFYAPWLHFALDRLREKFKLDLDGLMAYLTASPLFPPSREPLIKEGLAAWLAGDTVKAIHVLVPQVEAALRDLLSALGVGLRRYDPRTGGFEVIGMGAMLGHMAFDTDPLKGIKFHLNTLYCDQRGVNLRNQLAHGLADLGMLHMGVANWVVHSLLLLGCLRLSEKN
jgi:hypothetical protein